MLSSGLAIKTFGDPALERLDAACWEWWGRFLSNDRPCWLVIAGSSDTGKTYCADILWGAASKTRLRYSRHPCDYEPRKIWWPGFVNRLRSGIAYEELEDTAKWPLLYLDEIGATRDTTGFVADQLYTILAQREKRWTIVTTNLTLEQLATVDERIASRCHRNDGVVVEVVCMPFSMRPK